MLETVRSLHKTYMPGITVRIKVVKGATVQKIIMDGDDSSLNDFINAAKELDADVLRQRFRHYARADDRCDQQCCPERLGHKKLQFEIVAQTHPRNRHGVNGIEDTIANGRKGQRHPWDRGVLHFAPGDLDVQLQGARCHRISPELLLVAGAGQRDDVAAATVWQRGCDGESVALVLQRRERWAASRRG